MKRISCCLLSLVIILSSMFMVDLSAYAITPSSYETITAGSSKTVSITTAGTKKYYRFQPSTSGTYEFYSTGSLDTIGYVYDNSSSSSYLKYSDDDGDNRNFYISMNFNSSTTYYLATNLYSSSNTGSYTIYLKKTADTTVPTCSISTTNNRAASQTVTLSLSDNSGISGYYWGTSSSYSSNSFTSTTSTSITKTISTAGTYYLTARDSSGNVSTTRSITFYKTTLSANGGSVSPSSILTASGYSVTLPTPTKSGSYFLGWSSSNNSTSYDFVSTIYPSANRTYYAIWNSTVTDYGSGSARTVNAAASGDAYFTYTPSVSGTYRFFTQGSIDTYGYLYNSTMSSTLRSDDDSGDSTNFYFTYSLTAGTKYLIKVHAYSAGSYELYISNDTTAPSIKSVTSTNDASSVQTVTASFSDNKSIAGYYWGTSYSYYNNTFYINRSFTPSFTVSNSGTYYLTAKDTGGNVSSTYSITFYKTSLYAGVGTVSPSYVLTRSGNYANLPTPSAYGQAFVSWDGYSTSNYYPYYNDYLYANYIKILSSLNVSCSKNYYIGDSFDWDDLSINLMYADGTSKSISPYECTITGFDSSNVGTTTVYVTYSENDQTVTGAVNINILRPSIYVTSNNGEIKYYNTNDTYLLTGIYNDVQAVVAPYYDQYGFTEDVYWSSSNYDIVDIDGYDSQWVSLVVNQPSTEPVTITATFYYNGIEYSCSFVVQVFFEVQDITLTSHKTKYTCNQSFVNEKAVVTLRSPSGDTSTETVVPDGARVNISKPGKYTRHVSYFGKTVSYNYTVTCEKPVIKSITPKSLTSQTVSWSKAKGAKGYYVYQATKKNGKYKKIATVNSTSYTAKKLKQGQTYYYKVKAYYNKNSAYDSSFSAVKSEKARLASPSVKIKAGKKSASLSWKAVKDAKGYDIYRSTSKNGKYKKVGTVKSTSFKDNGLKSKKTYYYKVVAAGANKNLNSKYSSVKSVKTK